MCTANMKLCGLGLSARHEEQNTHKPIVSFARQSAPVACWKVPLQRVLLGVARRVTLGFACLGLLARLGW